MQRKKTHDIHQREIEPDNELLLWEKWIQIRNEETTKLAERLHKQPVDLAMNLLEKFREEKEWKTVLEHAQIEKKPSLRGRLWEQPVRLKQSCYCQPAYEIHRTRAETGKPPVIQYTSVPQYIKKIEKGLNGTPERIQCTHLNADFMKYKKNREDHLKEKIDKIDPFRPDARDLIVIGSKPKPPLKIPDIPKIEISPIVPCTEDTPCTVYAVRINNTVIFKDIPGQNLWYLKKLMLEKWHEPCTTWCYYFNNPVKRAGRCKLFLQNLGTVTLRFCWKKIKKSVPFIPEDIHEQVFFFNKNEDVLSPGQSKEIFITFLSKKAGNYFELWELTFCNICFYDTVSEKLRVKLSADSVENFECIQESLEKLKAEIDRTAISYIVSDIIKDAVTKATSTEPQRYPYKHLFLEAEMFAMKNPVCFYHQTEVQKMKDLYSEMLSGQQWDLKISSWRETMMAKEFDDRMKYYELLKKSHADFLKPWYEGGELVEQKYRAVKLLFGQMADLFDKKYAQLENLYNPYQYQDVKTSVTSARLSTKLDPLTQQEVRNVFYIHAYDYVATTIETCAGVLSSLDLNRWIEFDFCRS